MFLRRQRVFLFLDPHTELSMVPMLSILLFLGCDSQIERVGRQLGTHRVSFRTLCGTQQNFAPYMKIYAACVPIEIFLIYLCQIQSGKSKILLSHCSILGDSFCGKNFGLRIKYWRGSFIITNILNNLGKSLALGISISLRKYYLCPQKISEKFKKFIN